MKLFMRQMKREEALKCVGGDYRMLCSADSIISAFVALFVSVFVSGTGSWSFLYFLLHTKSKQRLNFPSST